MIGPLNTGPLHALNDTTPIRNSWFDLTHLILVLVHHNLSILWRILLIVGFYACCYHSSIFFIAFIILLISHAFLRHSFLRSRGILQIRSHLLTKYLHVSFLFLHDFIHLRISMMSWILISIMIGMITTLNHLSLFRSFLLLSSCQYHMLLLFIVPQVTLFKELIFFISGKSTLVVEVRWTFAIWRGFISHLCVFILLILYLLTSFDLLLVHWLFTYRIIWKLRFFFLKWMILMLVLLVTHRF